MQELRNDHCVKNRFLDDIDLSLNDQPG
jgi:hypothetical protein